MNKRRYRPKVAAIVAEENTKSPALEVERNVGGWQNLALTITAIVVGLILALLIAAVVAAALSSQVDAAAVFGAFSVRFLSLFIEAAPFLLLGTLVSGFIDVFVSQDHIVRLVPRNRFLGVLAGTFAGFVFPVCECGVVPVVRQLYSKKLPAAVGVAFLLAAPVMNPIVLLSTVTAFGFGPVLVGRYVITAIVAIAVGMIFALRGQKVELRGATVDDRQRTIDDGALSSIVYRPSSIVQKLQGMFKVAVDEFFEMGRFLVIGCLLAAGMQTLVSQDVLAALGQNAFTSVFTMQALAFILSVCSTVDAFLALAFTATFTTGSILTFLTFGPMIDIKTTTMFFGVFKPRTVAWLVVLPLVLTAIIGILLNLIGLT